MDLLSFEDVRKEMHLTQKPIAACRTFPWTASAAVWGDTMISRRHFCRARAICENDGSASNRAMMAGETPPIEVYQVGDAYFVLDGNHRVSSPASIART